MKTYLNRSINQLSKQYALKRALKRLLIHTVLCIFFTLFSKLLHKMPRNQAAKSLWHSEFVNKVSCVSMAGWMTALIGFFFFCAGKNSSKTFWIFRDLHVTPSEREYWTVSCNFPLLYRTTTLKSYVVRIPGDEIEEKDTVCYIPEPYCALNLKSHPHSITF